MDIDDIDFEDNIYKLSEMNDTYENILFELDQITVELIQLNKKISNINSLNFQTIRAKKKIEKEHKKFYIREILFLIPLICSLILINPTNLALLTLFISTFIVGTVIIHKSYLDEAKIAIDFINNNCNNDNENYNMLIRKQKELKDNQRIKRQSAFSYKKYITEFANNINIYRTEFNVYDRAIASQNSRKNKNDKKYCKMLRK